MTYLRVLFYIFTEPAELQADTSSITVPPTDTPCSVAKYI